jgi:hypothetical protein
MHTSGGRVSVTISGTNYSARATIKLDPSNISVTSGVNQDGSLYRNVAPKARTAEISFDRSLQDVNGQPLKWAENLMLQVNLQATFVEQDTNIIHILSGGFFTGSPTEDTSTGEISGLGFAAESYKTVKG